MADGARKLVEQIRGDETEPSPRVDVNVRSVMLSVIAVAATMYVLQWASEVFIPIVLSVLISYALEPIVGWLMRLRLPRMLASALVVASLAGAFALHRIRALGRCGGDCGVAAGRGDEAASDHASRAAIGARKREARRAGAAEDR